jgi:hypothetical protein
MTTKVHLRGENGAVLYFDSAILPESIAHRLARGDLTRVTADGAPWDDTATEPGDDGDVAPDGGEPPAAPPDAPPLPGAKENRAVWTEFAIAQGMDRAKAASMTKAQLVDELTKPPAAP